MPKMEQNFLSLLFLASSIHIIHSTSINSGPKDTISTNQTISDDGETIVSSDGAFELGFFSPGGNSSGNRYVGIWYKNTAVQTIVWVANRDVPLVNTTGVVLKVIEPGRLVLLNQTNGFIIWSTSTSRSVQNPVAQLSDSGNLVVRDSNDDISPENFLWQSFDYPTDTSLGGMKQGWNFVKDSEVYFTSWRSQDDPGRGEFTSHLDPTGYPQIIVKRGAKIVHRAGPWNGLTFSGFPYSRDNPTYRLRLVMNENETSLSRYTINTNVIWKSRLNPDGVVESSTWINRSQSWMLFHRLQADSCDTYMMCGPNGICRIENSPSCECLDKFVPKDERGWKRGDWSSGCVRKTDLSCQGDDFLSYSRIKMPDARNSSFDRNMTLEECRAECSRNCSCTAYTQLDISNGGSGCLLYFGELVDIRVLNPDGQDLYIRMASSGLSDSKWRTEVKYIASAVSIVGLVLLALCLILFVQKRKRGQKPSKGSHRRIDARESELPLFTLSDILKATDNFSVSNKLGEGGFGPVYKGVLEEGQEIGVKRLSKNSKQGLDEFMNEVILIAQLQHRNLVKLLGCCIEGDENMLIYEYMPNKSLDVILFDKTKSMVLDWPKRFQIILGIARGVLYLHQDSRLRIIHRDLKTSNILLDSNMNPKISDFGMARSFGENETGAKTRRVVGTFGYMSPEYAMDGIFSLKSDVFSFGVILLEIISGNKNRGYSDHQNLLGHAWTLHREHRSEELIHSFSDDSLDVLEALRVIHVGLLCIQTCPEDRPSMSSVVFMLENEVVLPNPKQPGFFLDHQVVGDQKLNETNVEVVISINEITITQPDGR